jgi:hypothetical protein
MGDCLTISRAKQLVGVAVMAHSWHPPLPSIVNMFVIMSCRVGILPVLKGESHEIVFVKQFLTLLKARI